MSYARFGWDGSDVYVFYGVGDVFECCGCLLQKGEWVDDPGGPFGGYLKAVGEIVQDRFPDPDGIIGHLREHQAKGHTVPADTFTEIERDWPRILQGRSSEHPDTGDAPQS